MEFEELQGVLREMDAAENYELRNTPMTLAQAVEVSLTGFVPEEMTAAADTTLFLGSSLIRSPGDSALSFEQDEQQQQQQQQQQLTDAAQQDDGGPRSMQSPQSDDSVSSSASASDSASDSACSSSATGDSAFLFSSAPAVPLPPGHPQLQALGAVDAHRRRARELEVRERAEAVARLSRRTHGVLAASRAHRQAARRHAAEHVRVLRQWHGREAAEAAAVVNSAEAEAAGLRQQLLAESARAEAVFEQRVAAYEDRIRAEIEAERRAAEQRRREREAAEAKIRAEAAAERERQAAAAAAQLQEQEEKKAAAGRAAAKAAAKEQSGGPGVQSAQAWADAQLTVLQQHRAQYEPAMEADPAFKRNMRALRRDVRKRVQQISSTVASVQQTGVYLAQQLLPMVRQQHAERGVAYVLVHVAEFMLAQASTKLLNSAAAFAMAYVAKEVASACPAFMGVLLGSFVEQYPAVVPRLEGVVTAAQRKSLAPAELQRVARISLGFRSEGNESESTYLERQRGAMYFFGALAQATPQIGTAFGVDHAWTWLARVLNQRKPAAHTSNVLGSFLEVAGFQLAATWPAQFRKAMTLFKRAVEPHVDGSTDPRQMMKVKLALWVDGYLQRGGRAEEPEGRSLQQRSIDPQEAIRLSEKL